MEEVAIKVVGLCKNYKGFSLKDISFELPKGYIMGFVGPNGAGKSTLIKSIMNLVRYNSGSIEIFGQDIRKYEVEVKQKIGYVSDEQHYYEDMTIAWTGDFVKGFYENWDQDYFKSLLEKYDLNEGKKVKELSKGMKMKLSLALALSHHPEVLILDEPTSGLDPIARSEFLDTLQEIVCNQEVSVFFSSHITEDIEKISDYIMVIKKGQVLICDEKESLLERWKIVTVEAKNYDQSQTVNLKGLKKGNHTYSFITEDADDAMQDFQKLNPEGKIFAQNITISDFVLRMLS